MPRRPPNRSRPPVIPSPLFQSTLTPEDRAARVLHDARYRLATALGLGPMFAVGTTDHARRVALLRAAIQAQGLQGRTCRVRDGRMLPVAQAFQLELGEPLNG